MDKQDSNWQINKKASKVNLNQIRINSVMTSLSVLKFIILLSQ